MALLSFIAVWCRKGMGMLLELLLSLSSCWTYVKRQHRRTRFAQIVLLALIEMVVSTLVRLSTDYPRRSSTLQMVAVNGQQRRVE